MALRSEHVGIDGLMYRILSFDRKRINTNKRDGVPHVWHGVAATGQSGIFATFTERVVKENGKKGKITNIRTHKVS